MGGYFSKRLTTAAIQHNLDVSGCSFIDFGRPSRTWGIIVVVLETLVLSLSKTEPSSSGSGFWCTSKCEQVVVGVQSTKLLYMRQSPVYILRASWQPSGQP